MKTVFAIILINNNNIDWPLEWAIVNRNDKRASRGRGENYVTETGPTFIFSPGHPNPTPHKFRGRSCHALTPVHFKFAPVEIPMGP